MVRSTWEVFTESASTRAGLPSVGKTKHSFLPTKVHRHHGRQQDGRRVFSSLAIFCALPQITIMSTVAEIKEAIAHLSPEEYCELMADLQPFADDEWDLQMKADATSGKLDFIDKQIEAARQDGTLLPLEPTLEKM